jgi:hypothetical protein
VIEAGLTTFIEVGAALMEVRDRRLYRAGNAFESYCTGRWSLSDHHVNRLVSAAKVAEEVGPMGLKITSERQARELTPLLEHPEELHAVAREAVADTDRKLTAASLRTRVNLRTREQASSTVPEATPLQAATIEIGAAWPT